MTTVTAMNTQISIHAPIRGRQIGTPVVCLFQIFQSTPPYGGDDGHKTTAYLMEEFQSTPPYGGDLRGENIMEKGYISIHAPIRGRRRSWSGPLSGWKFQSTPPYGGDPGWPVFHAFSMISIHAPIRGRHIRKTRSPRIIDFNPRPHTGATK